MKKKYVLKNKRRFYTFLSILFVITLMPLFASKAYGFKEPAVKTIYIKSGDTLWDIASKNNKHGDIREYIYAIKKINNLQSSDIKVGDKLLLPISQ